MIYGQTGASLAAVCSGLHSAWAWSHVLLEISWVIMKCTINIKTWSCNLPPQPQHNKSLVFHKQPIGKYFIKPQSLENKANEVRNKTDWMFLASFNNNNYIMAFKIKILEKQYKMFENFPNLRKTRWNIDPCSAHVVDQWFLLYNFA